MAKRLLYAGVLFFFIMITLSPESYGSCLKGDCRNGTGVYEAVDGRRYEGDFKKGIIHGQGTLILPDGTVYSGQFQDGQFHGKANQS